MIPTDLLAALRALGLRLDADGGALRVSPRGLITPSIRTLIRRHKDDLIAALASDECPETTPFPIDLVDSPATRNNPAERRRRLAGALARLATSEDREIVAAAAFSALYWARLIDQASASNTQSTMEITQ